MLALVLTLVFGLSTFHGHADALAGYDVTLAVDVDGVPAEKGPAKNDRHDPSGCPICALHAQILGTVPTEFAIALIALTERYALTSEMGRLRPPSELHRPPIDAAL